MRVREGGFAYEIAPYRNPETLVREGYVVRIFKLHPIEVVIQETRAESTEEAHRVGLREIAKAAKDADRAA